MDREISALAAIIDIIRAEWSHPRIATHQHGNCPFLLRSSFVRRSAAAPEDHQLQGCPAQLLAFWRLYASAELFKDDQFGQWGVEMLSAEEAQVQTACLASLRPVDMRDGDVVFGRFYGDADLLVMDAFGAVLVCLPLDEREDWPEVAGSLAGFLLLLLDNQGAKYWEI
ncbi:MULTISPECIES: hypothetical protein [Stenotrophomonas]|uniref:hypothetical protein n=1 Tax=Stenotrophomonas TaxID=40323 RepID=UPI0013DBC9A7|nr:MULTISPECIES: hypothetical protein [Stenotrophomonas]MBH1591185.1 hypothetical protein [Stenotrophomonas maltophilia]MDH2023934.1 hypothetical protein [Stenotrophomonas sp. GD03680]MDI9249305.1 hypothetical protein [Stenotrophomonas sp. RS-48]HDS1557373.1 hypothetical protein [Stenotrophomonas maltophilia]HEL3751444.1 hypothetical protein [Stenotrophomonas maltophilia]